MPPETQPTPRANGGGAAAQQPTHRVSLRVRPSVLSVPLRSLRPLVVTGVVLAGYWAWGAAAVSALDPLGAGFVVGWVVLAVVVWCAARVVYEVLLRWSRVYTIEGDDVTATSGVLHRTRAQVPLRNVQQVIVDKTLGERLLGMGTVLISSAGSQRIDVAWVMVPRPDALLELVRAAVGAARPMPVWLVEPPGERVRPVVIGLVGGIGAGKSTAAQALGELGCLVVDADREARAALDRPEVRGTLVRWWGPKILTAEGLIDRGKVAEIVFAEPMQRNRLEALVHPMVKADRRSLVKRAAEEGRPGVVIDAPLLFEAGSDKDCDAVFFVEAPREVRLARVAKRGWDAAELDRREAAQMPLDEKRSRADEVILNDGDRESLGRVLSRALEKWRGRVGGRA
jgi:dephospho-CoA kinase